MPTNLVKSGPPVRVQVGVFLNAVGGTVEARAFHFDAFKLEVVADPADTDPTGKFLLVRATGRAVAGEILRLQITGDNLAGAPVNPIASNVLEFLVTDPVGMVTASEIVLSIVS